MNTDTIYLKSKKDEKDIREFRLVGENKMKFLKKTKKDKNGDKKRILDFDMSKLEMEYDYDTDQEQIDRVKNLLSRETIMAIDYFVKDDPLLLVGNLYSDLTVQY